MDFQVRPGADRRQCRGSPNGRTDLEIRPTVQVGRQAWDGFGNPSYGPGWSAGLGRIWKSVLRSSRSTGLGRIWDVPLVGDTHRRPRPRAFLATCPNSGRYLFVSKSNMAGTPGAPQCAEVAGSPLMWVIGSWQVGADDDRPRPVLYDRFLTHSSGAVRHYSREQRTSESGQALESSRSACAATATLGDRAAGCRLVASSSCRAASFAVRQDGAMGCRCFMRGEWAGRGCAIGDGP